MGKIYCKREEAEFDESEFDSSGEHLHKRPAHYITGELKSEPYAATTLPEAIRNHDFELTTLPADRDEI